YTLPAAGKPFGRIANWQGGTLIGIGGHVHPGGLSDNIDLIRGGGRTRIFTSEAKYWPRADGTAPPDSWDMSMTVTWKPRWAVHVDPGDTLRISATYDTAVQSTYEDMGISIAMLAPDDPGPALDPFTATHDSTDGYHTITTCENPCNGATGIAYPLSNATAGGTILDGDSTTLGYGPAFGNNHLGAASNSGSWTLSTQGLPAGTVLTYYCRIHPFM